MTRKRLIPVLCGIAFVHLCSAQQIEWKSTTETGRWQDCQGVTVTDMENHIKYDVIVTPYKEQKIDGFGGCFNELGWVALNHLDTQQRQEVLDALFHLTDGVGFTFCRTTIGANDFARGWYSYNETDGDFKMRNFSIDHDKDYLIPYIKSALAINPDLRLWACPWSPPTWMKTNRHYANKSGEFNDLKEEDQVLEGDQFIQDKRYLDAYALYLSKYVKAYKKEGIDISMIQFQNEPYTRNQYPNCLWTPEAMRNFIANHMGPLFAKKHKDVEVWFGTLNCNSMEDIHVVMGDPKARKYIKGMALQWEGKDIIDKVHRKYHDIKLMQSENECGNGAFDWDAAEHTFDLIRTYVGGGAGSYMYWNMILQDKGHSTWGWGQNAMIVIDSQKKTVNYTPEYYVMKHLSYYVRPGDHKLKTMGQDENLLAFKDKEGKTVLLYANKENKVKQMTIVINKKVLNVQFKPKSFNTLVVSNL